MIDDTMTPSDKLVAFLDDVYETMGMVDKLRELLIFKGIITPEELGETESAGQSEEA